MKLDKKDMSFGFVSINTHTVQIKERIKVSRLFSHYYIILGLRWVAEICCAVFLEVIHVASLLEIIFTAEIIISFFA